MTDDSHFFDDIFLGCRSRNNLGQLRVSSGGIHWKKKQGDKTVEVNKVDVLGLTWMKVPRTNQLLIRLKDGFCLKFTGFRDQDIASMNNFFKRTCGIIPEEKQLSVAGRNWGVVNLNGNMLTFMVDSKQAFEVSLADVLKTRMQGKNEVALEFHLDDTTGVNEIDTLMDMTFHVPVANTQLIGDKECTPAEAFHRKIISVADAGTKAEEAVVAFENLCILTPRGRYNIDLNLSFLRLQARGSDFKIQYTSIVRLFSLPKSKQPHTFVVITLNPPIWRGKTLYPHIVIQFETDIVIQRTLSMSEEVFKTKYKDKLAPSYTGLLHDVFTTILRALSGAKVTRPGNFRSCQDGYAMRSSLRAQDGLLYPLERSFFFLPKPPTLVLHEDIVYVEFQRHIAGSLNGHYFDLLVKLRGNEQDHLFHNIRRSELHNLFTFIRSKGIKVLNPGGVRTSDGGIKIPKNPEEDGVDPHLERIKYSSGDEDDSDEDDVDFVVDKYDLDSSTGESSEEESDGQ